MEQVGFDVMVARKSGPGRPAKPASERQAQVAVRFPPALLAEVDALAASRLDAPDRSSIIRELVAEALSARKQKGRK